MSKRLQVILVDEEMAEIREIARSEKTTVAEWVRRALRSARSSVPSRSRQQKLAALRVGSEHAFPAADVASMLDEIEHGYGIQDL
ncbi:MAG: antitoxin [Gemmatimonadetes bacterium]|nr:antitoxin [Gemmatimonadota bacterium]NNK47653.1 antitoxin [Gemmatimonadota bacterium]